MQLEAKLVSEKAVHDKEKGNFDKITAANKLEYDKHLAAQESELEEKKAELDYIDTFIIEGQENDKYFKNKPDVIKNIELLINIIKNYNIFKLDENAENLVFVNQNTASNDFNLNEINKFIQEALYINILDIFKDKDILQKQELAIKEIVDE